MSVTVIESFKQFQDLINSGNVVVIDFWASWCGPCRMISPVFEKMASESEFASITFAKVNIDENDQIASELGIRSLPTFATFQNGNKLDQVVGASPQELRQLLLKAV
ncbi:hypothetical protein ASPVEDRAFT_401998 [Aspergillus versicolor CBS 583.65]|uniref:Thioredoxin n=1 Tax=Aspergillus versicolor CBS 583.65 TaxID=1036611 RepID=A0A1L9Q439_ASPVE|nr:uncharacterized protein ASPVEDRAFT_401998 [Aspergillus versicolor CBS 583.65]OJJ08506.1 hypothetical protein ASPVEDRAFT_401998 [Aspergillus versicolor CBS 583.65]